MVFANLKVVFFIGLGLLAFGLLGAMNQQPESGSLAMAGSILVLAAVVGNSINAVREVLEERKTD
jgi:hypothetical protein